MVCALKGLYFQKKKKLLHLQTKHIKPFTTPKRRPNLKDELYPKLHISYVVILMEDFDKLERLKIK
jgi:hypothetical protein